ncbi:MAG: hypothetical protein ACXWEV_00005 [Methylobacter sp.]
MSKTAQRKDTYYFEGQQDYKKYGEPFTPFVRYNHPFNKRYMAGYNQAKRDDELSVNNSILQRFRVKFAMASA